MKGPAQTPCLGIRVSALADGSLRADVRDRALAHTLTCRSCRDALDVERLTVQRLRSLPGPAPSSGLMAALSALGEPGGPVPPRRPAFGPGMASPAVVPLGRMVGGCSAPPSADGSLRPGGPTRPGGPGSAGRRRTLVVAAAGALGAGFLAAGMLAGASPLGPRPSTGDLAASMTSRPAAGTPGGAGSGVPLGRPSGGAALTGPSWSRPASFGAAGLDPPGTAGFLTTGLPAPAVRARPTVQPSWPGDPGRGVPARVPVPALLAGLAHAR